MQAASAVAGPKTPRSAEPGYVPTRRLVGLDAARGGAMLLTCFSHFAWSLDASSPTAAAALTLVGMIATPAFLLLSGAVVGAALERGVADPGLLGWRLVDRGLFVMIVGHLLLAIALAHYSGGFGPAFDNGRTTDAIGLAAVLAGMLVARRLSMPPLWLLVVIVAIGWATTVQWHPATKLGLEFKWLLLGHLHDPRAALPVAEHFVPYLALYFFGVHVGRRVVAPDPARALTRLGASLVAAGLLVKFAGLAFSGWIAHAPDPGWAATFAPTQKLPPSPAYLLFYGGLAILMLAGCLWRFAADARTAPLLSLLVPIGRASLVVYVFQYFVYAVALPAVPPGVLVVWPAVLVLSLLPIWAVARAWAARDGNRWLTLGLFAWHRRRAAVVT